MSIKFCQVLEYWILQKFYIYNYWDSHSIVLLALLIWILLAGLQTLNHPHILEMCFIYVEHSIL